MSSEILNFIEWKHSWSSYEFSCLFFNVLDVLTKNKKFWCFDSICLLLWIKFWFIIDWWWIDDLCFYYLTKHFSYNPSQSIFTSPTYPLAPNTFKFWIFHQKPFPPSFFTTKTGHPLVGVLLGLSCNYIKFWYFCVFALWPKSLRFYVKAQKR